MNSSKSALAWMYGAATLVLVGIMGLAATSTGGAARAQIKQVAGASGLTTTPTPECGLYLEHVPSPNDGRTSSLRDIDTLSATDAWAVGVGTYDDTLAMRWDGSQWTIVPSPNLGQGDSLEAVEIVSATDAWAVGFWDSPITSRQTMIQHWDGTEWSVVPSPSPGSLGSVLYDVEAVSANDVWAVGTQRHAASFTYTDRTLVLHWDGTQWSVVPSPNVGAGSSALHAVSVIAANDIWAAGFYYEDAVHRNLFVHWDGTQWSTVPGPVAEQSRIWGIDGVSPTDVWAVGERLVGGTGWRTVVIRWNGTQWNEVPSPSPSNTVNALWDISARSASDAWAVGYWFNEGVPTSLVIHWDGNQWSTVPATGFDGRGGLNSVKVVESEGVWAVGSAPTGVGNYSRTLTLRRGTTCATVIPTETPTPAPASATSTPTATPTACPIDYGYTISSRTFVSATNLLPGSQCWECVLPVQLPFPFTFYGQTCTVANISNQGNMQFTTAYLEETLECPMPRQQLGPALLPHAYANVDTINHYPCEAAIGSPCGIYTELSGSAPNRIYTVDWRVRYTSTSQHTAHFQVHLYEGSDTFEFAYSWVSYGGGAAAIGVQNGVARYTQYSCRTFNTVMPGRVLTWSPLQCGTTTPTAAPPSVTLTLTVMPIATSTATGTSTGTRTALPTATAGGPTVTPTSCTLSFTDVPPDHTFYANIMCLACRGVISGYSDGTFRPGNDVTRGQLSKIVSLAAGWNDPVTGQSFEDVPPSHTFYEYIERLAGRGHVGGYACGGEGEPCVPLENRPYFRPGNAATRGQIAKIVSSAAGHSDTPPRQSFEDVPPAHTFYLWIERLYMRGIVGGYACGGPNEPCVPPTNRPYFRPNANTTRGQLAKIVANTWYPGCGLIGAVWP